CIAVLGNGLVLLLIWRFKTLRTKTSFLIVNLALADIGISLLSFPLSISNNFMNSSGWSLGSIGCQIYGFTGMLFGLGNIGTLTLISIDRYLLTCKHSRCNYAAERTGIACLVSIRNSRMQYMSYMCLIVIVLFLVAWTPYAVVCLWSAFGDLDDVPLPLLAIPSICAKTSACYNPVVYSLVNERFQLAFRKMVGLRTSRRNLLLMRLHNIGNE
ncbi:OPSX-like protein, partial [Mya arenaria]